MSFNDGYWDDTRTDHFVEVAEMVATIQPTLTAKYYDDGSCSDECEHNNTPFCKIFGNNTEGRCKECIDSQI